MNSTKIILIALAFCLCILAVPVAALWANGNWVPEDTYNSCDYVVYDHQTDVTSCYRAYSAESDYKKTPDSMQGVLRGSVRCGYNLLTTEIGIRNDANPDGVNGTYTFFPILPDGTFEIELIPGNFTLMVKDGNGGQPEYSHVRIIANAVSYPEREILGHAVSAMPEPVVSHTCPIILEQKVIKGLFFKWIWFRASMPDGVQDFTVKVSTNHGDVITTHQTYGPAYWHLGAVIPKAWTVNSIQVTGCKAHEGKCTDVD